MRHRLAKNKHHYHGFFIHKPVSNNAFSYNKRINPDLYVAPLIEDDISKLLVGSKVVFEDFDDQGNLKSCDGLENFLRFEINGNNQKTPVYIFDNHNHAFYFWNLEATLGRIKNGVTLLHIDQHKDSRQPASYPNATDLQTIFTYTNTELNVGNFIDPALHAGLIASVINITSQAEMDQLNTSLGERFLLDIDMDFFAPELDYINNNQKIDLIKKLIPRASLITIATSPFFIDQNLAIKYLRKIF